MSFETRPSTAYVFCGATYRSEKSLARAIGLKVKDVIENLLEENEVDAEDLRDDSRELISLAEDLRSLADLVEQEQKSEV